MTSQPAAPAKGAHTPGMAVLLVVTILIAAYVGISSAASGNTTAAVMAIAYLALLHSHVLKDREVRELERMCRKSMRLVEIAMQPSRALGER